ncbi:MAG: hypothetical protein HS116_12340 [Planctomycetes bacterium]|nr:hypothetical protein [Planctomycetota bacterium]
MTAYELYREIWATDCEWGFRNGRPDHESEWVPLVFCLVGLRSGTRYSFWGADPRLKQFVLDHADDLFVSHNNVAEMKYLLRLGIPLPAHWFDTFVAERWRTNAPGNLEAGLSVALHRRGLPNLAPAAKTELQQRILHLRFDPESPEDRREITAYCFSDCDGAAALYTRLADVVRPETMAWWTEFLKAVARMEIRGIPIDLDAYGALRARFPEIREAVCADANQTWPVFVGRSFQRKQFLAWLRHSSIAWPVTESKTTGRRTLSFNRKMFSEMTHRHPFIAEVKEVKALLAQFGRRSLVVDPVTRRHYYQTHTFRSITGRNQPKKFIFSCPKWLRFTIVSESPDHVLVYVDYVAQEIGIAAALSGDTAMREIYCASDCHMAAAIRAGAAPAGATKKTHPEARKRFKAVNLGTLYGQTAIGIAQRLGICHAEAEALLTAHRRMFPIYWSWSERMVQGAFDRGEIRTPCGWRSIVPPFSNERTWMNWPMQAAGGDIMRLTLVYLDRQNVRIMAPVHDGFLLSCHRDKLADLRAAVNYACQQAVEHVLPGFPLRWEFSEYGDRFDDEDGANMWSRLQTAMREPSHA